MAQNKAKLRAILRSGLANKKRADELLDAVLEMQSKMDQLLAKLDADTGVTDTDYVATVGSTTPIED